MDHRHALVEAHSRLVQPWARRFGMDAKGVMGCPTGDDPREVPEYKPGETIDVRYHRNNHIGGFIRWSIIKKDEEKTDENESKAFFDQHAFLYTCRESGANCVPRQRPEEMLSGDYTPPDGLECGDKITLPDWLDEGEYVLQWTWFGVGHHNGEAGVAENQFRSCADIKLTAKGPGTKPACPRFVGGDRMSRVKNMGDNVCLYFFINDIITNVEPHRSADPNSDVDYKFGIPAEVEKCNGGASAPPPVPVPAPPGPGNTTMAAPVSPPPTTTAPVSPSVAPPGGTPGQPTATATGDLQSAMQRLSMGIDELKKLINVPGPGTVVPPTAK